MKTYFFILKKLWNKAFISRKERSRETVHNPLYYDDNVKVKVLQNNWFRNKHILQSLQHTRSPRPRPARPGPGRYSPRGKSPPTKRFRSSSSSGNISSPMMAVCALAPKVRLCGAKYMMRPTNLNITSESDSHHSTIVFR